MAEAVVVQTAYLGDLILTTPLITSVAELHGPVDVVTTPEAAGLIETHRAVAAVVTFDKRGSMGGARGIWRAASKLKRRRYRYAYLPHRSIRSALLAWAARIPKRVGFDDAAGRWLYSEARCCRGTHEFERLRSLAQAASLHEPAIELTESDQLAAEIAITRAGISDPFVVIAPGSTWANKRWPYYRQLAERISSERSVVVVGTAQDSGLLQDAALGRAPCVDLAGRLGIRESAAVIARAAVAVTNDSAPLHLAGAVKTPVVALFGPTTPALGFGPRGFNDAVLGVRGLACRPCSTHGGRECPLGHHRCMRDLAVDAVVHQVESALAHLPKETVKPCV